MKREDAIEKVRQMSLPKETMKILEALAPELAESEDERIRTFLLDYAIEMIAGLESDISLSIYDGIKGHDPDAEAELTQWQKARAYLEKQKESLHIPETCKENAEYFTSQCGDNRFELIDKAKRDIIAKTNIGSSPDEMKVLDSFLFRAWQMGWLGKYDVIVPEQKQEWSEEDERIRKAIINYILYETKGNISEATEHVWVTWLEKQKEKKPSINIDQLKSLMLQYLQEAANEKDDSDIEADTDKWARKILGYDFEQKPAEPGYKHEDYFCERCQANAFNAGRESVLKEQKPVEWSEEDEKYLDYIIKYITNYDFNQDEMGTLEEYHKLHNGAITWLKSIRPQPKVELSEDVEKTLDEVSHILVGLNYKQIAKDYKQAVEKLLYSRPSWKPSEEQMRCLEMVLSSEAMDDNVHDVLAKLYEQLKNLM